MTKAVVPLGLQNGPIIVDVMTRRSREDAHSVISTVQKYLANFARNAQTSTRMT